MELQQRPPHELRELALFAACGGGILGGRLLGWRTVCGVEINRFRVRRLLQRQNEGHLPSFPVWDDVCTFDGCAWRGGLDILSGGFPCKGVSVAGDGSGLDHDESKLWHEQARIIGESEAPAVWIENSPALTLRGGVRVIADLAQMGYDCRWGVVSAADAIWSYGVPCLDHLRERIWIAGSLANADRSRRQNRIAGPGDIGARGEGKVSFSIGEGSDAGRESFGSGLDKGTAGINDGKKSGDDRPGSDTQERGRAMRGRTSGQGRYPLRSDLPAESSKAPDALRAGSGKESGELAGQTGSSAIEEGGKPRAQPDDGRQTVPEAHPYPDDAGREQQRSGEPTGTEHETAQRGSWWAVEPGLGRMAHGVPHRVDRLEAIGDGQVPAVVKFAWGILT